jgi:hypothetical protein
MSVLAPGCLGPSGEPGGDPLATGCGVPRLAAAPEAPARENRPGNPPVPTLTEAELAALMPCVRPQLVAAFRASESPAARAYGSWQIYTSQPFGSEHGSYLEIVANDRAAAFGRFEDAGVLPEGAIIAKPHFSVAGDGAVRRGPLLLMEKMRSGFSPATGDWRFTMVAPNGAIAGETAGRNAGAVEFCIECHKAAWRQDFLMFVPPQYRRRG